MTKIKASGADGIYIGGVSTNNGGQLVKDKVQTVGDNDKVKLLVSDGFVLSSLFDEAGADNVNGAFGTAPTTPPDKLTGEGKTFVDDFAQSEGDKPLKVYTVYAATAAQVLLDAISRSDGSRSDVLAKLFETDLPDTVVGPMSFNEEGDPKEATETVYGQGRQVGLQGDEGTRVETGRRGGPGCPGPSLTAPVLATAESAPRLIARRGRRRRRSRCWIFGALLLAHPRLTWLIDSFVSSPSRFTEVTLIGFTNGSIYALVALGLHARLRDHRADQLRARRQLHAGHVPDAVDRVDGSFQIPLLFGVIGIPLGTAATAATRPGSGPTRSSCALVLAMLFCMVINVSIERIGYKPLRNQPKLAPLITAIGFSFILQNIGLAWKRAGPDADPGHPPARAT